MFIGSLRPASTYGVSRDNLFRVAHALVLATWLALSAGVVAAAELQPEHAEAAEGAAGAEHEESLGSFLSRVANFAILAGVLYYLLRSPLTRYLDTRGEQIRSDLKVAADTQAQARVHLAEIEERLKALPGELEAFRRRGKEDAAAEQARLEQKAQIDQRRLLEQTHREIDRQVQIARRELTAQAADLAVKVARSRLKTEVTGEDQARLVDSYVAQVGEHHE